MKIKNGMIIAEDGRVIAVATHEATDQEMSAIAASSELIPAVNAFLCELENGSLKPKKAFDNFNKILDKHDVTRVR